MKELPIYSILICTSPTPPLGYSEGTPLNGSPKLLISYFLTIATEGMIPVGHWSKRMTILHRTANSSIGDPQQAYTTWRTRNLKNEPDMWPDIHVPSNTSQTREPTNTLPQLQTRHDLTYTVPQIQVRHVSRQTRCLNYKPDMTWHTRSLKYKSDTWADIHVASTTNQMWPDIHVPSNTSQTREPRNTLPQHIMQPVTNLPSIEISDLWPDKHSLKLKSAL